MARIAVTAARASAEGLIATTSAALTGAISSISSSRATQRYQQLLVEALDAIADAGAAVPFDYLLQLAAQAAPDVPPRPRYVHAALVERLQARGVPDAHQVADRLLPGATW